MRYIFLIITAFLLVVSCSADEEVNSTFEVGSGFIPVNARIIQLDTFEIKLSTFRLDSIATSSTGRALVGKYTDSELGEVIASSYFQLSTTNFEISEDAVLDSVALILGYDNYYYSDTLRVNNINIHLINEEFDPKSDDDLFYNINNLSYDETPLISRNYIGEPFGQDSIHVSMNVPVLTELFEAIQNEEIEDQIDLQKSFPGLTLQPERINDGSVIGFSTAATESYLRFFYNIPSELEEQQFTYDLTISSFDDDPESFINIEANTSIQELNDLEGQEDEASSEITDNVSYLQSGVGYMCEIEFPTIREIIKIPDDGVILSATLQIRPTNFNDDEYLPENLSISVVDLNNDIVESSIFNQGNLVLAERVTVEEEFNEVVYEVDIGDYITEKIEESPILNQSLVLYDESLNNSVNRVIVDGTSLSDFETKLIINYAVY